jgi:hypothetical protein
MEQRIQPQIGDRDRLVRGTSEEPDPVRVARARRDAALTPAQRLDKLAALCRQAALLRTARRLP